MDKVFNSYIYNVAKAGENSGSAYKEDTREEMKMEGVNESEESIEMTQDHYLYFAKIRKYQIIEIAFLLSTLLNGKRRAEMQKKLLSFEFVNQLKALLKEIIWRPFNLPVT
eukprot:TRINITY_DN2084_c0_g3_i1.p1 TRINITY_DN2084_c0_g3~~TRINITY_DN2084_c0_g3_i1.p1  ORF type:complete len:111 (-),score=27.70 TRINITY_DN2084_c0_g3_i1:363-695(-)